ncbi:MAG: hypothetical protein WC376_02605 [Candidatus Nanoarchaeia archaeon]|jgi:Ca2+/Na+ antiporter
MQDKNQFIIKIIFSIVLFVVFLVSWIFNNFKFITEYIFIFILIFALYLIEYIKEIKYKELEIKFGKEEINSLLSEVKESKDIHIITKTKSLSGTSKSRITFGNDKLDEIYTYINKGDYTLSIIQTSKLLEELLMKKLEENKNRGLGYLIRLSLEKEYINKNEFELFLIFSQLRNSIVHFNNDNKFIPSDITNILYPVLNLLRTKLL